MLSRKRISITTLATILSLGGIGTSTAFAGTNFWDGGDHQDLASVLNASTSLIQAIGVAEQKTGAKAFKIDLNEDNGLISYEIKSVKDGKIFITTINSTTGKILKSEGEGILGNFFNEGDSGELDKFAHSSMTLTQVIGTAEKQLGGTAVEAGFEDEDKSAANSMAIRVKIAKESSFQTVFVDVAANTVVDVRNEKD